MTPIHLRDTKRSPDANQSRLDLIAAAVYRRKHGVTQAPPTTAVGAVLEYQPKAKLGLGTAKHGAKS